MIGKTYLEKGKPVVVLVRWKGKGPRNVLIQRAVGGKMEALNLQLRRLNTVSDIITAYREDAVTEKNSIAQANFENALGMVQKVAKFINSMNIALAEVEPDCCPKCGHVFDK